MLRASPSTDSADFQYQPAQVLPMFLPTGNLVMFTVSRTFSTDITQMSTKISEQADMLNLPFRQVQRKRCGKRSTPLPSVVDMRK